MVELTVDLPGRAYPICIGAGAVERLPEALAALNTKATVAICTDSNVGPLYADRVESIVRAAGLGSVTCTMPAGEANKRLAQVEGFCGDFLAARLDRGSVVIALGGGVLGDVAAFSAASFMRGVPVIQIPTTIVAQVDSSVGGKTGVNHPLGKNTIGAFHQPAAVLIDTAFLVTLPERELRAGLAEVIKHGVIADAKLFEYMETEAARLLGKDLAALEYPIERSCEIKAAVVAADEREHGQRANLNYGHTFGHAFEAVTGYTEFLHGEAIALGMHAAGLLSRELNLVDDAFVQRQKRCLEAYGLPVQWNGLPVDACLDAMRHDKKVRAGTMKFILADRLGHVVQRTDITEEQVRTALEGLRAG